MEHSKEREPEEIEMAIDMKEAIADAAKKLLIGSSLSRRESAD